MRRAALLLGSSVLGLLGAQRTRARNEREDRARLYGSDWHPDARFRVVSRPLEYKPSVSVQEGESFLADLYWSGYETRVIRYENTRERVLFFPPAEADVDRNATYRTGAIRSTDELAEGVVTIEFQRPGR
ncbi:hypothetical protein [Natrinema versiforme]|uniref:Uncharacterized protein n=1 Tax=Natrinema versiforme TaxID=88724 RepID=A0A4P8WLX6_9EURY|nr:hypothetical protein [Natrinema versiforme]QCS42971.1 hypothetical protein FEJ81_11600 [Natrinema versiforme]